MTPAHPHPLDDFSPESAGLAADLGMLFFSTFPSGDTILAFENELAGTSAFVICHGTTVSERSGGLAGMVGRLSSIAPDGSEHAMELGVTKPCSAVRVELLPMPYSATPAVRFEITCSHYFVYVAADTQP